MAPEQQKIVKAMLVKVAADFEVRNPYYRHGLYSTTDAFVDDLTAALAAVGVVWTFGRPDSPKKGKRK